MLQPRGRSPLAKGCGRGVGWFFLVSTSTSILQDWPGVYAKSIYCGMSWIEDISLDKILGRRPRDVSSGKKRRDQKQVDPVGPLGLWFGPSALDGLGCCI